MCKRPCIEFSLILNQFQTVCPKLEAKCLGKLGNSKLFSAQSWGISEKKKKKKRSSPKFRVIFRPKLKGFFCPKLGDLQKKKKKGLHQNLGCYFVQFRKFRRLRGAVFEWGGYFPYFTSNRPQKHKKHAILHTSQANGGGSPPPWLRYCLMLITNIKNRDSINVTYPAVDI